MGSVDVVTKDNVVSFFLGLTLIVVLLVVST
jgi:hypothetical protein